MDDHWIIRLIFTDFNLDSESIGGQCDERYDHVKVVDGSGNDRISEYVYCGKDKPDVILSSSTMLTISFVRNYGYGGGFTAQYTVV